MNTLAFNRKQWATIALWLLENPTCGIARSFPHTNGVATLLDWFKRESNGTQYWIENWRDFIEEYKSEGVLATFARSMIIPELRERVIYLSMGVYAERAAVKGMDVRLYANVGADSVIAHLAAEQLEAMEFFISEYRKQTVIWEE